ncbi:MAG TPA: hypothetical protein VFN44_21610, partial [Solirubrobacteraceae bacterium]|nr:hypothetical protein [Solirubrobacteraceae bacterium]
QRRWPVTDGQWECGRHMEIALLIIAIIVAVGLLARSPMVRPHGQAIEAEMRAVAGGANVDKSVQAPAGRSG